MKKEIMLLLTVAVLVLVDTTWAYSKGVPVTTDTTVCQDMLPKHSEQYVAGAAIPNPTPYLKPNTATALYEIWPEVSCFKPGDTVKLYLRGKPPSGRTTLANFKGVFAMARRVSKLTAKEAQGTFTVPTGVTAVKAVNCFSTAGNAVSHTSNTAKTNILVHWKAPANLKENIQFVATFVDTRAAFFINVKSKVITYSATCSSATTMVQSFGLLLASFLAFMYYSIY